MNKVLESKNIDYINLSKDLINDYLIMVNDPEISKYISREYHKYTYEEEECWVERKLEEKENSFSMIEKNTGEYIGNISIVNIVNDVGEMGICITSKKQDKHYGTEAIETIIDYGFNKLKLNTIYLKVFSFNERAIHCYKKLGFTKYRVDKNIFKYNGEAVDEIYMDMKK